jgi:hypothetical protein
MLDFNKPVQKKVESVAPVKPAAPVQQVKKSVMPPKVEEKPLPKMEAQPIKEVEPVREPDSLIRRLRFKNRRK